MPNDETVGLGVPDSYVGRCIYRDGTNFTVQGVSARWVTLGTAPARSMIFEEVRVWNPDKQELVIFGSRELFENWAYGTPIPAASR